MEAGREALAASVVSQGQKHSGDSIPAGKTTSSASAAASKWQFSLLQTAAMIADADRKSHAGPPVPVFNVPHTR